MGEPLPTAGLLTVAGVLLVLSAVLSRASGRLKVPTAMLFLAVGILAGDTRVGGFAFDDYRFAFRIGTLALTVILFDGGFNTPLTAFRGALWPALILASVGVVLTAAMFAVGAWGMGLSADEAMVVGAVVSSTDAAAVFAILRGSGLSLKRRVGRILELESGLNDPVAVILTMTLTERLAGQGHLDWTVAPAMLVQLAIGAAFGILVGRGARFLVRRLRLPIPGLYPVFTLGLALLAYGATTLVGGSGFLAVYLTGAMLGGGPLPYHVGLRRVHDAVAWFAQVAMFLLLGLLVRPEQLVAVALPGLTLGLFLCFVARPAAVAMCLAPFRPRWRDFVFISWVGLRGAVPIVLATTPVLAGAPGAAYLFNLVFFAVVVSALLQGGTVGWLTRRLGLESAGPPPPPAVLEIASVQELAGELLSFYIGEASAVAQVALADVPLPEQAAVVLVVRGRRLIAPRPNLELEPGDHVYVVCDPGDAGFVRLMMGQEYED
jgi:cell volume regulation protein A